ncbi:MAG: NlpC/P60 family protein [Nitrospiraceae bacterium]
MPTPRETLVESVRTWIDVPYRDKGRNRQGVDCIGLLLVAAQEVNLTAYDTLDYPRRPNPQDFLRGMKSHLDRIPKTEAGHGDIMVFAEPRHPCHVGILDVEPNGTVYVIHAYAPVRKVIREPLTADRRKRAMMAFRLPAERE